MDQTSLILVDDNDIPVAIDNIEAFSTELVSKYFEASNHYLAEYNKLKKNRSVESLVDLWQKVFYYLRTIMKI